MTIEDDYAFTFKVDWWIVDDNCFELPADLSLSRDGMLKHFFKTDSL